MTDKEMIRKEQRNYLEKVVERYGITLSDIAKKIKSNQTTITRFYNSKDVKHVLSSITFGKVKAQFPLEDSRIADAGPERESDIALMYVLKMIFHLLLKHRVVDAEGLDFNFTEALNYYRQRHWLHAAKMIEGFRTFVTEEPHQLEKEAIRRLLELAPLGSA